MQYTHIGKSGVVLSRLCLGTMNFGAITGEEDSHTIMDRAIDMGINFFDTADRYGFTIEEGYTEKIIGRWFVKGGSRREKVVLATKVYGPMSDWPNMGGLSAVHIKKACEDSLRRLQTDHIDLYQMHHIDRKTPWEEIWQAMEQLVLEGKIIYVGSSNFAAWNIVQANEIAKKRHFMGIIAEQSLYNLMTRTIELEVIPACKAYGVGIIPWSPLAGGLLGGVLGKELGQRRAEIKDQIEYNRSKLASFEELCTELGERPADVAIAWLLSNRAVTAPVVGPRTVEQLDNSLRALDVVLSESTIKQLDSIFPGPGGQAPEAYAW